MDRKIRKTPRTSDEDSHSWLLFILEYVGGRSAKARISVSATLPLDGGREKPPLRDENHGDH